MGYAEWKIKNIEHNEMFDMRDTVQIWPSKNDIAFSIISIPGNVEHSIYMNTETCRDFANYLLKACDKNDYVKQRWEEHKKDGGFKFNR